MRRNKRKEARRIQRLENIASPRQLRKAEKYTTRNWRKALEHALNDEDYGCYYCDPEQSYRPKPAPTVDEWG